MSIRVRHLAHAWLPLLFWLAVIAFESSTTLSAANTGKMLRRIVVALFGVVDLKKFETMHALLRKAGHFAGYAILSLLFFRALVRTGQGSGRELLVHWRLRLGAWAVLATFIIAALDEWHQSMLPTRTGRVHDVLLDTAGALLLMSVRTMNSSWPVLTPADHE